MTTISAQFHPLEQAKDRSHHGWAALLSAARQGEWRLLIPKLLLAALPEELSIHCAARLYRLMGFRGIDPHAALWGVLSLHGGSTATTERLTIGRNSVIGYGCEVNLGGSLDIGAGVHVCHHASFMTGKFDLGGSDCRAGPFVQEQIKVEDGVWIGAHAIICSGVTVGRGSVVAPGSVVVRDVPANALVQGNPARVIRWLDRGDDSQGEHRERQDEPLAARLPEEEEVKRAASLMLNSWQVIKVLNSATRGNDRS